MCVLDNDNVQVNANHECLQLLELDHYLLTNTTDQIFDTIINDFKDKLTASLDGSLDNNILNTNQSTDQNSLVNHSDSLEDFDMEKLKRH